MYSKIKSGLLFILLFIFSVFLTFVTHSVNIKNTFAKEKGLFIIHPESEKPIPANTSTGVAPYLQKQANTCGLAAISYFLSRYGVACTEEQLYARVKLEEKGVDMLQMIKVLKEFGFDGKGAKVTFDSLPSMKMPTIAFMNENHYVVILGISKGMVTVFDPSPEKGVVQYDEEVFLTIWNGIVILTEFSSIESEP